MTHHGVELVQGCDECLDLCNGLVLCLCKILDIGLLGGYELVERRIEEADSYGIAFHSLVDALEVSLLHGLELCKSGYTPLKCVGADHLTESCDTVGIKEHMLGAGKADALCAELTSLAGVVRSVGIGAHL